MVKKNSGEIDNIRGFLNGLQFNSGYIKFNNAKSINVKGNLKSDIVLNKLNLSNFFKGKILENFEKFQLNGNVQKKFIIQLDHTLKIIDYQIEASGNIKKSELKIKEPQKYLFVKNED